MLHYLDDYHFLIFLMYNSLILYYTYIKLPFFYYFPQHFLYFLPLPQGQGSFGLTFPSDLITFWAGQSSTSNTSKSSSLSKIVALASARCA